MTTFEPPYARLARSGELARRAEQARGLASPCRLCPRRCGVDRAAGGLGFCRTGSLARVSHAGPHFGEEPPLRGEGGAGTVFFAGCNMACVFCQNHQISQEDSGREVSCRELARVFLDLQSQGCHNLDLVSPTHVAPQILEALGLAAAEGLRLPVVYNSGGYDAVETLRLFDGVVDVYLPDAKYADEGAALRLSKAPGYVEANKAALREMFRQVGVLRLTGGGAAERGLLVRHLVLPNGLAGTEDVLRFIADALSPGVTVSLMSQYSPCHLAGADPAINRPLTAAEYEAALDAFDRAGLESGFIQEFRSQQAGLPDFDKQQPFEW